jgi:hypothetical protein
MIENPVPPSLERGGREGHRSERRGADDPHDLTHCDPGPRRPGLGAGGVGQSPVPRRLRWRAAGGLLELRPTDRRQDREHVTRRGAARPRCPLHGEGEPTSGEDGPPVARWRSLARPGTPRPVRRSTPGPLRLERRPRARATSSSGCRLVWGSVEASCWHSASSWACGWCASARSPTDRLTLDPSMPRPPRSGGRGVRPPAASLISSDRKAWSAASRSRARRTEHAGNAR